MVHETSGELRFRLLADNAPVMIWRADASMGCDWFNEYWLAFTGRTLGQELGFGWADGVHPDDHDHCLATYTQAFERREPFSMTYRLRRADGAYRWLLDKGRPFFGRDDSFCGYFGSCVDVDDMMRANDALARIAREKENVIAQRDLLLHEVQHRVRNNLQLILSIIDMQARGADAASRRALHLVAGRVRSIAKAQALIIDPTETTEIDFTEYVVSLAQSAVSHAPNGAIRVRADTEPVRMQLARAVPLGLVLNEIFATCVEHGFAGVDDAVLDVAIRRADGALLVETGAGTSVLRAGQALVESRALSLKLIERLGAQAGARVEPPSEPDGKFVLRVDDAG